jgi:integrase
VLLATPPIKTKLPHLNQIQQEKNGEMRVISPLEHRFKSLPARHNGNPVPFELWLREYVLEPTAFSYAKMIRQLCKLGDIGNPDKIRTLICTHQVSEGRKELLANAYDYYVNYNCWTWTKPRFTKEDKPIFLPFESELDQLISNARDKMSIFLQFLKETGVDSGEARKLRWIDVNTQNNTVGTITTKNHNARTLVVSSNMISRLMTLQHKNESFWF